MSGEFPIPARTNLLIVVVCTLVYFLIFYTAAHTESTGIRLLLALAFGIVMIPVYSLIHEAEHMILHPNRSINIWIGRWLCCMFIVSFTFFRHCHLKHHRKNRTDEEMWDLYYEHQNKWARYGNLYGMMIGIGYLSLWLSVILFAFAPRLIHAPLLRNHTEINGFLIGSDDAHKLKSIRLESLGAILFQILLLYWLNWPVGIWLLLYLVHGFIWSSQNYVNHAFSPRDIINGAHNLKVPVWLKYVYLNFNVHLAHHQNPQIPWLHLPRFIQSKKGRISFFRNYVRLWKGPKVVEDVENSKESPPSK